MKNTDMKTEYLHTEKMAVGYDRHILIDGIDIAVNRGEILTIIGPNGSGKSTVLRSIIGQLKLIGGSVFFGDRNRENIDKKELARKMSVLMTDRVKTELMTCFDVVASARYPYTGSLGILSDEDRRIVIEALETVDLKDFAQRDFNNISDGQRQRVMLARCIAQEPELIVLDEPTSFLDIRYKLEFLRVLERLKEEKKAAVIMSVHEIELARQISDRVVCIGNNGIDRIGTKEEIFKPGYICDLFGLSIGDYKRLYPESREVEETVNKTDAKSGFDTVENGCLLGSVSRNGRLLRKGITTGTCAAAAAYAAAYMLLNGNEMLKVSVNTPVGETVLVPVFKYEENDTYIPGEAVSFYVVKDSGDDPDVTNGARIIVSVSEAQDSGQKDGDITGIFTDEDYPGIMLTGGRGVGTVTKEGLEQPVGYPAINKVPRMMIFEAVERVRSECEDSRELLVTVSVDKGEELAAKTFNPELGIKGGISILGTGGILEPMSDRAVIDTIETMIRQQAVLGHRSILITPGLYGRGYVKNDLKLPVERAVKCSNFIGDAIDLAGTYGCTHVLLVGNLGKLIKLAAGIMNTHSRVADGRMDIMCTHLALCGGSREMIGRMYDCINTDTALDRLKDWGLYDEVLVSLTDAIHKRILKRSPDGCKVGVMLFSEKYGYLGETEYAKETLKAFENEYQQDQI